METRAITDEASEQRWHARCQVWVERSTECVQRIGAAEAAAAAMVEQAEAAHSALVEEMEQAGLDPEDIEHVLCLS
jgi:hypothetical protein